MGPSGLTLKGLLLLLSFALVLLHLMQQLLSVEEAVGPRMGAGQRAEGPTGLGPPWGLSGAPRGPRGRTNRLRDGTSGILSPSAAAAAGPAALYFTLWGSPVALDNRGAPLQQGFSRWRR